MRGDETMTIEENMLIVCHPNFATQTAAGGICDNYLVSRDGAEPLHKIPQTIIEID